MRRIHSIGSLPKNGSCVYVYLGLCMLRLDQSFMSWLFSFRVTILTAQLCEYLPRVYHCIITHFHPSLDAMTTGINATSYSSGIPTLSSTLHTTTLIATLGTSSYLLVCAFAPLILAPISEQWGRRGMMMISSVVFTLCYLPQALAPDVALVIAFRGIQGAAASAANR